MIVPGPLGRGQITITAIVMVINKNRLWTKRPIDHKAFQRFRTLISYIPEP
jgi:hypothetical protein